MAKNSACFMADQQLNGRPAGFNPVVLTSDQEDSMMNKKFWNTGYKLYKLKNTKPHLFAQQQALLAQGSAAAAPEGPPGFERVGDGWFFNPKRQIYLEEATGRVLWLDAAEGVHRELREGEDISAELVLAGAATTSSAASSSGSGAGRAASKPGGPGAAAAGPSARHLMIMDLHKAADVFKLDLSHLDKPAAMMAVYRHAEGALAPETAAKGVHERLLRRLAAYRGSWSSQAMQAALAECLMDVAAEHKAAAGVAGAVALIFGARLIVAASHGATCAVADKLPGDVKDVRIAASSSSAWDGRAGGPGLATAAVALDSRSTASVLLHTVAIGEQDARAAAAHVDLGRCRAGAVSLLQAGSSAPGASERSHAAACARLSWAADDEDDGPAAKRARTEKGKAADKVRCRQVLLKYVGCKLAVDKVRRKPITRSLAEAEGKLLEMLGALAAARASGGAQAEAAAFTQQCRALSECQSSLKGGDLAGDIGWLTLPVVKPGEKLPKEKAAKLPIIRAALALAVNEVSDIVVSEEGVHVLKRAA